MIEAVVGIHDKKYYDGWRHIEAADFNKLRDNLKSHLKVHYANANFGGQKTQVAVTEWEPTELIEFLAEYLLELRKFDNYNQCVDTDAKYVIIFHKWYCASYFDGSDGKIL